MLISKRKEIEEITRLIEPGDAVLVVACNGCAESFGNAEQSQLSCLKRELEQAGHRVADVMTVDFACEPSLVKHWVKVVDKKESYEAILVVSCGIGVQTVAANTDKRTYPACDTVSFGGRIGQSWSHLRCRECGECMLGYTGGLCPLTSCSKGLLNGPCGGSKDGRCEVNPSTRECGWHLIYEKLKAVGRLDLLGGEPCIKDYSKSEPPEELVALQNQIASEGIEGI